MSDILSGSDLTRAILEHNNKEVLCAVSNNSDNQAIADQPCLLCIASFNNGRFVCKNGDLWKYAVPVKKIALTQTEVGL
ncbi:MULTISPECIES: hypothetical protein [unclassified Psychrobacter]|uniref:hypothetical protein n=1 Tax=unclassified Psychrobacter TaxID=196806 RepID=UPI0018887C1F|nr:MULTISPECIES: hypothetical protein [unclassified Psychrobacter]MBF2719392.1 hypothetical protein [Psychrobacter sp. NG254]MBI0427641.1 hypothetical protein [Psychrobacter sp. NG27]